MKNNKSAMLAIACLGLLAISCSSQKNMQKGIPAWADNPRNHYNEQQYLMAVGSGNTLDEATSDAFAGLSRIFQMDIDATEELNDEFIETTRNNSEFISEGTSQLLNTVKIGTRQELMNTTILESEVGSDGTYYALAGMDRMDSGRIYNQEISNNVFKIEELEANSDKETNVLQKLILLKKARVLAGVNENLSKQYNIIRGGVSDTDMAARTFSRIDEKFRTLRQTAVVSIVAENVSNSITSAVAEVFQKAGFSVSNEPGSELLEAEINFNTQRAELNRNDAEFVKWELIINIKDKQTNHSFNTFMDQGRDGALSYRDALSRADFTAGKNIKTKFQTFLNQELLAAK